MEKGGLKIVSNKNVMRDKQFDSSVLCNIATKTRQEIQDRLWNTIYRHKYIEIERNNIIFQSMALFKILISTIIIKEISERNY